MGCWEKTIIGDIKHDCDSCPGIRCPLTITEQSSGICDKCLEDKTKTIGGIE